LIVLRVLAVLAGLLGVAAVLTSSVRTVVLPRGEPTRIARSVFLATRSLFELAAGPNATYERRDRVLALYSPSSLLILLATWLLFILAGYTLVFWGVEGRSLERAFRLSVSSVTTVGFEAPSGWLGAAFVFTEAAAGLVELALLITYLPTLYAAFQRRETQVSLLEVRAGSPPTGVEMLERFQRLDRLDHLDEEVWERWEVWFADVEETHTSLPALAFFRSPQPDRHWITAAGAVLDGASLMRAAVDLPPNIHADLCIRAGYLALREIADFFRIPHNRNPKRDDPISITREEFEAACERLRAGGLPMVADADQAWRDFAGWRVNYDRVLISLALLTAAPWAPWSSDRSPMDFRPAFIGGRRSAAPGSPAGGVPPRARSA